MIYEIYNGPSILHPEVPILGLLSNVDRPSENSKTGNQVQLWILLRDQSPVEGVKTKADVAICGTCPLRGSICYVNHAFGTANVWRSWKRGNVTLGFPPRYKTRFRSLRLGAYGDPAALPIELLTTLVTRFRTWTGFTHLWRDAHPDLRALCMASVETPALAEEANLMGWRSFRIRTSTDETRFKDEALCAHEATHKEITCENCGACNGNQKTFTGNIVTTVHGLPHKIVKFHNLIRQPSQPTRQASYDERTEYDRRRVLHRPEALSQSGAIDPVFP